MHREFAVVWMTFTGLGSRNLDGRRIEASAAEEFKDSPVQGVARFLLNRTPIGAFSIASLLPHRLAGPHVARQHHPIRADSPKDRRADAGI